MIRERLEPVMHTNQWSVIIRLLIVNMAHVGSPSNQSSSQLVTCYCVELIFIFISNASLGTWAKSLIPEGFGGESKVDIYQEFVYSDDSEENSGVHAREYRKWYTVQEMWSLFEWSISATYIMLSTGRMSYFRSFTYHYHYYSGVIISYYFC